MKKMSSFDFSRTTQMESFSADISEPVARDSHRLSDRDSFSIFAMIDFQHLGLDLLDTFQLSLMNFRPNFNDFACVFH